MTNITVHTDGASRGNPGAASIAYVVEGIGEDKITGHQAIGLFSNNQAEYRALLAALDRLIELNIEDRQIDFLADSELMIKQVNGQYRVKDVGLKEHYASVQNKVRELEIRRNLLSFTAIRREQNQLADSLANQALDEK